MSSQSSTLGSLSVLLSHKAVISGSGSAHGGSDCFFNSTGISLGIYIQATSEGEVNTMFIALHPFGLGLLKLGGEREHQPGLRLTYFHSSEFRLCPLGNTTWGKYCFSFGDQHDVWMVSWGRLCFLNPQDPTWKHTCSLTESLRVLPSWTLPRCLEGKKKTKKKKLCLMWPPLWHKCISDSV